MAKKKRSYRRPNFIKKYGRMIAQGVSTGMILTPAVVPAIMVGRDIVAGQRVGYALGHMTSDLFGFNIEAGDMSVDFGKVSKFAVGGAVMVGLGLAMRRFLNKKV